MCQGSRPPWSREPERRIGRRRPRPLSSAADSAAARAGAWQSSQLIACPSARWELPRQRSGRSRCGRSVPSFPQSPRSCCWGSSCTSGTAQRTPRRASEKLPLCRPSARRWRLSWPLAPARFRPLRRSALRRRARSGATFPRRAAGWLRRCFLGSVRRPVLFWRIAGLRFHRQSRNGKRTAWVLQWGSALRGSQRVGSCNSVVSWAQRSCSKG